ncbi:MAG TPA: WcaF family extracellular polysaccharide biosynthesis acetyltransferase [Burkholderiaceae bacterium]|nr:WcaF family extracellular polysaccharide biosynthesis acetyltransferase [Usitatibacter sp.]HET9643242.1 WcaF family extracellular polysaccharide biosynthesis acetyltransferase [Burkholderiaceae bacterium]
MNLAHYSADKFERGRPSVVELLWLITATIAFARAVPFNFLRVAALRVFGASLGRAVVVKPGVRVKFPWRLRVGDHSWIGEDAWIDNLDDVVIGSNTCISQGAYLCTGNHDWKAETFDLMTAPITVGDGVWIAAKAMIAPGVVIGNDSIVTLGCVLTRSVPARSFCSAGQALVHGRDAR